jgi:hypothetical protein
MGHKKVCFNCRKAFSIYGNNAEELNLTCPECGEAATLINHKFRPPKQSDVRQWKVAEFLRDNGFFFQHQYERVEPGVLLLVSYPKTMEEAEEFVAKYKK